MLLFEFVRLCKNYQGDLKRGTVKLLGNYLFGNEIERRYVPQKDQVWPPAIPADELAKAGVKQTLNEKASSVRLRYEADDVRYLIVAHESDRKSLVANINASAWTAKEKLRLAGRILTMKQIKTDF